ncbi:MAG TPA: dipeptidase [Tissierellaceae bacterium]
MNLNVILNDIIIIDGHADIPEDVYLREIRGEENPFHKHYQQLKNAGLNIVFTSIFTKGSKENCLIQGLLEVERMLKIAEEYEDIVIIRNKKDLDYVLESKKLGFVLSLEGFEPLYGHLELLDMYYRLGVRAAMLTWNKENPFAHGSEVANGGLTELGFKAIERMNELGIIVDVSHLNDDGFWDIIKANKKLTVASHSNARALFNHPRNLTDDQIKAIAKSGGIIGINSYFSKVDEIDPGKVRTSDDNTETIHDVIKHIEYIVDLVGYDHVAFGFDFNMYLGDFGVKGLEDAEKIPDVIKLLLERGHSVENVKKIAGENWIRILRETLK